MNSVPTPFLFVYMCSLENVTKWTQKGRFHLHLVPACHTKRCRKAVIGGYIGSRSWIELHPFYRKHAVYTNQYDL